MLIACGYLWATRTLQWIVDRQGHSRTLLRLDQQLARKANAAAEGLCKFAWASFATFAPPTIMDSQLGCFVAVSCLLSRGRSNGHVPQGFQDRQAQDGLFEGNTHHVTINFQEFPSLAAQPGRSTLFACFVSAGFGSEAASDRRFEVCCRCRKPSLTKHGKIWQK